ncbi:MAG: DNA polymerase IV [Candidatus Micrarchaeia archaeon]
MLVDMDYFYAACEEKRHPELKGKPLIVGNASTKSKTHGVVQTCNYEARAFGIHSGMSLAEAFSLKPDANYIEADEAYYESISSQIMSFLKGYHYKMEVMSIDEAAIDLGEMPFDKAVELGNEIKSGIKERFGLPCTIGISTSKAYAKMACDAAKPNGLLAIDERQLLQFISNKSIDKLPGIGKKTAEKLKEMGIEKVSQLAKADPTLLKSKFGSFGIEIYLMANGKDQSTVAEQSEVLSISREKTLAMKTSDLQYMEKILGELSSAVWQELEKQGYWYKGVSVKVRYEDFTERIKSESFSSYESSKDLIYSTASILLRSLVNSKRVRKLGVRVFGLVSRKGQKKLFS